MPIPFHHTHQYFQVTNQMITACKAYITNNGSNSIWDQPQQLVVDKIKAAIHLNQVLDTAYWQNISINMSIIYFFCFYKTYLPYCLICVCTVWKEKDR